MGTYALSGGASGIGAALSARLKDDGHNIINVDIKDADVVADLSNPEGRQNAVAGVSEMAEDGLDGLVPLAGLAAGSGHPGRMISAVNYFGALAMVEGLKPLLAKKSGAIVLISSNSGPMAPHDDPLVEALLAGDENGALAVSDKETGLEYMAGKRALAYWMRRHVMDYGRAGIRINAVAPGPIDTPMVAALNEQPGMMDAVNALLSMAPIDRLGKPHEVANTIRFLLSDEASYIVGTTVFIDGGYDATSRTDHL